MSRKRKNDCSGNCCRSFEVILERDSLDRDNPTRKVDRWIAWFGDRLLVEGSRDPEHDACRTLLDMGITGKVAFRHKGSPHPSMSMDIEKAAKLAVRENDHRFKLVKYEPLSRDRGQLKTAVQDTGPMQPTGKAKRASTEQTDGGAS